MSKRDIFDNLVKWRDATVAGMKQFKFTDHQEVDGIVGPWQAEVRLHGRSINVPKGIVCNKMIIIVITERSRVLLEFGRHMQRNANVM